MMNSKNVKIKSAKSIHSSKRDTAHIFCSFSLFVWVFTANEQHLFMLMDVFVLMVTLPYWQIKIKISQFL